MKKSLFRKLLLSYLIVVLASVGVLSLVTVFLFRNYYLNLKEKEILQEGENLSRVILSYLQNGKLPANIRRVLEARALSRDIRVIFLSEEDLSEPPPFPIPRRQRKFLEEAHKRLMEGQRIFEKATIPFSGQNFLLAVFPLQEEGRFLGALALFSPLVDTTATVNTVLRLTLLSGLFAVGLSFLLAFRFSRSITQPLQTIREKARSMASGNFETVIELNQQDEIGELAQDVNYLSHTLGETLKTLKREKTQIESILKNMQEGVVAVDQQGEIFLANPAFLKGWKNILKTSNILNSRLPEKAKKPFLKALQEGEESSEEFSLPDGRYFILLASPLQGEKDELYGAVGVFQDVSELKKIEKVRREFLANVSHELRTPLTSIRGFLEAMIDGVIDEREREKYLQIIHQETLRLGRLVSDVLELARLESGKVELERREVNLALLIERSLLKLTPQLEEKNLTVKKQISPELPHILADEDRMEQVLLNLLNNAIFFSPQGGEIIISAIKKGKYAEVSIEDQGPGIPEEELPYIFERFYRVEKSRAKKHGGLGLGLSIAKQIIELHGGEIGVESKPGQGSRFYFRIGVS